MSDFVPFPPRESVESLCLVGFRLDPTVEGAQFYTLLALEGENDRPLMQAGRILFFLRPEQGQHALEQSDNDMKRLGPAPLTLEFLCDVAEALYLANSGEADSDGLLLETIACFDDLIRAIRINVPAEFMGVLHSLSERLSETPDFGSWLRKSELEREKIEDALMWCVGAVAVKSSWV